MASSNRSLRRIFLVPTLAIVILVGLSLSFFAYVYSETAVQRQIEARIQQLNHQVSLRLESVFEEAESVLKQNALMFGTEIIDYQAPSQIRSALFSQLRSFSVPTSLYFGNLNGGIVVAGHEGKGQKFYEITTENFLAGSFTKRRISEDGTPIKNLLVLPNYDARARPWFKRALLNEGTVTWGEVYVLFTGHDLSIAPSITIKNNHDTFIGVAGMDIFVSTISPILRPAQQIEGMITILIERKTGFLIASSDGTDVFSQTDDKKVFERVRASASHNKVIATAAEMLGKVAFGENQQTMGGAASILHSNENFVLSAESIGGENRPGWLVVSIMPRAAVSAPIEAQFFSLIGLIVTGCLLSVAVVFVFSRRVTKPLGALIETIDGQGDLQLLQFDKEAPRELEILRRSLISAENRASESMHIADMRLQRLNAIFKAAPDAILLVSASSVIQSANESAAKLLGHSMEALVGMSIEHLIPQRSQSTHQHHVERFLKNIESQTATMGDWRRVHCRTKSGKEIPILASLGRISNDPTSDTVVMIRDMSDAKVADDNLRQLSFELARELEAAKEADRAKSGFLAQMSHELRTPLNAIIGFSEAGKLEIFGEISPKIYRDYAGNIHRSGLHLLSLVNDILDFSKIDANKHDIELNIFDIRALLIETMKISQVIASENNVRLRCKNSRLFDKILADRRALHQCLLNLLSNAIRHSHENGTVLLRLISTAETLEFHVIDYGVGISPDNLKKIGKPFEQFENPMTSGRKGTGLGLAITKSLMELMRGRLEIESTEGVGTTAKLVFPKQPDSEFYNS